jgi:hypothetical protein
MGADGRNFVYYEVGHYQGVSSAEFVLHGQIERDNAGFFCLAEKFDVRVIQKHFQSSSGFAGNPFLGEDKGVVGFV